MMILPHRPVFDYDKTYYLSGPMTGYEEYNYPEFERAAAMLRDSGIHVLSPHENPWPEDFKGMSEDVLWEEMMRRCAVQMEQCDGIILLEGWPYSKGATLELAYMTFERIKSGRPPSPVWFLNTRTWALMHMGGDE